jgi:hypothetical protein
VRPAAWKASATAILVDEGEQQVLDAHELVLHALRLGLRGRQDLVQAGRDVDLPPLRARPRDPGQPAEHLPQPLRQGRRIGAGLLHDARGDAAVLLEQGHREMLGLDLGLPLALGHGLRLAQRILRLLGQPIGIHAGLSFFFMVRRPAAGPAPLRDGPGAPAGPR